MKRQSWIKRTGRAVLYMLIFLLLLLLFSLEWVRRNYGNIGMEEILFHLNMPLQGTEESFIIGYIKTALIPSVAIMAVLLILTCWPSGYIYRIRVAAGKKEFRVRLFPLRLRTLPAVLITAAGFVVLFLRANSTLDLAGFIYNQMHSSTFIEEEYVDPQTVSIVFPEKKRNLITIYMESAETSAQDKANGGLREENVIPEMTQIAKDNISFSQSDLIEGAVVAPACGWTIAALVAETAGLPLKLYAYADRGIDNTMKNYEYFMPGATSLGDILEDNGYKNYFIAGSNFKFGGRTNYFTQHGDYEIFDLLTARETGKVPADYKVWWGFEDEKLYQFAKEQLTQIAESDQPFSYSMLTVDTHHQNGYRCRLCKNKFNDRYSNVWACASAQVNDFVEWVKQQDFYENTTIVIMGDHCSMDTDFYGDATYDKHNGETVRKVYNAIINAPLEPVQEKNRKFTTMDMFPTSLAALGVTIEGDRLGLGTNLFSDRETLSEEFGYDKLFDELGRKSVFYNEKLLYP